MVVGFPAYSWHPTEMPAPPQRTSVRSNQPHAAMRLPASLHCRFGKGVIVGCRLEGSGNRADLWL